MPSVDTKKEILISISFLMELYVLIENVNRNINKTIKGAFLDLDNKKVFKIHISFLTQKDDLMTK